jgi:hypothetical protein
VRGSKNAAHFYWLVAAFAAVALAFLGATLVQQRATAGIDREVADLQVNSLPSVGVERGAIGARFWFELPRAPEQAAKPETTAVADADRSGAHAMH